MPRRRYRRRSRTRRPLFLLLMMIVAAGAAWRLWPDAASPTPAETLAAAAPDAVLTSDRPEIAPEIPPRAGVTEKGETDPAPPPDSNKLAAVTRAIDSRTGQLLQSGRAALGDKQWLAARSQLNEALTLGLDNSETVAVRADLTRLADETIFSGRIVEGDPFVAKHVVQAGHTLAKIAAGHKVSVDFLATTNGIVQKDLIQIGHALKVVNGPFHAVVDSETFTLDVFLGEGTSHVLVRHFKVGLGQDEGTPKGVWKIRDKLKNPTYYPPRGGKIVPGDDPTNPLGERWIGLEGVSGPAVGQQRYGIHGTIEPHSIGKNASMGCVRMYNEDVEALYDLLVIEHSTVTIK